MTSARGHGAIIYCLNLGSEDSQTGRHNGDGKKRRKRVGRERGPGLGWRKGKSPALDGEKMRGEPWLERTGRERERKGFSPRLEWKDDERRWR
ncbi:hypothetical protein TNCV_3913001 [Trichonephila clavipes]|nr:hypothetical protein TNCV_3913001 [Trichonephila clavipes]